MPKKKTTGTNKISPAQKKSRAKKTAGFNPAAALLDAYDLYAGNKLNEVILKLESFNRTILRKNKKQALEYYRLMTYSLVNLGDYAGAEIMCRSGQELDLTDPDFYFADCFIALNYKEYSRALEAGLKYLDLYQSLAESKFKKSLFSYGREHLIYNYLGVAARANDDIEKTVEYFEKAIAARPSNPNAYLNLANFFLQARRYDEAEKIINRGMKDCSQVQELQMLRKTLENRATVSACMIVKNEEEMLPGCLNSIRSWVDEIIIVDTGSTDRTVEIAKEFGAKIFHQEWTGNFSFHRNYSIDQAACDWVFIIDADEEVDQAHIPLIKQALAQQDYRTVTVNVYNMDPTDRRISSHLPSIRFFRRESGIRYDGIVHNQLQYDKDEKTLKAEISIWHYGYNLSSDKMERKFERTRVLLEKQIEENPDFAFAHFNLAQLYRSVDYEDKPDAHEKAIYHAARTIELTPEHKTIHLMAHYQKASALYKLNRYREAEEYALKALKLKDNYLDPLMLLGHIYVGKGEYNKARDYYNRYLTEQQKVSAEALKEDILLVFIEARYIAHYNLGLLEEYSGNFEAAEKHFIKAYEEHGVFENICLRLARIYLNRNDLDSAAKFADEELVKNSVSSEAHLIRARCFELKGILDGAAEQYELAVKYNTGDESIDLKAGTYFANNGQLHRAAEIFENLCRKNPGNIGYQRDLGDIYLGLGKNHEALEKYTSYLGQNSSDIEIRIKIAACHFRLGEFDKAEVFYTQALENDSNLGYLYRNLGLTKFHLEKYKDSLVLLTKYLEIAPEDLVIESAVGACLYKTGNYAEAINHLEKYLRHNPTGVEALFYMADCYRNLGYADSAILGFTQVLKLAPGHEAAQKTLAELVPSKAQILH